MFKFVLLCILFSSHLNAEDLIQYDGKKYTAKDLPVSVQQSMAELESELYNKKKMLLQDAAIDLYVAERAKTLKKSEKDVLDDLLAIKDPSDAEAKKFYEENKARIPYPYDTIKAEIKKIMVGQKREEAKTALLTRIENQKKVRVLLKEPEFPKIDLKVNGFYHKGKPNAKVHIVEFADYQCPHCKAAAESFQKALKDYGDKVYFTYVDFPINPSGISRKVAEGAYCAHKQGKFWEYHYMAFDKQRELTNDKPKEFAKLLKMDEKKFDACLDSKEAKDIVNEGRVEGERVGVSGTPGIFINGRKAHISHEVESLKQAIDKAMAGAA